MTVQSEPTLAQMFEYAPVRMPFAARQKHPLHLPYMKGVHEYWKSLIGTELLPSAQQNEKNVRALVAGLPVEIQATVLAIICHESKFQSVCFIGQYPDQRREGISEKWPAPGRALTTLDNGLGLSQITTAFYNARLAGRYGSYIQYPHWSLMFPSHAAHITTVAVLELLAKKGDPLGVMFAWAGSTPAYPTAQAYRQKPNGIYPYYEQYLAQLKRGVS